VSFGTALRRISLVGRTLLIAVKETSEGCSEDKGNGPLVHLQSRLWAMSYSDAYELAERISEVLLGAHKVLLSIAHKVS
jgi:hypothetical protein